MFKYVILFIIPDFCGPGSECIACAQNTIND